MDEPLVADGKGAPMLVENRRVSNDEYMGVAAEEEDVSGFMSPNDHHEIQQPRFGLEMSDQLPENYQRKRIESLYVSLSNLLITNALYFVVPISADTSFSL